MPWKMRRTRIRPTTQIRKRGVVIMEPQKRKKCMIPWYVILCNFFFLCSDSSLQVRLFSYIANFDQATTRKFQKTNGMLKADEPHTFGFPSCSPDLTISTHGIDASTSKLRRDRDA